MKPRQCQACGSKFFDDERFCDNCGGPLSEPKAEQDEDLIAGRYKLVSEAGKGGMGIVYLAHDQFLNREVAFKLLHANLANRKSAPKRLLREARAAGRINHPNVIQIYDAGKLESDGRPYLVMEFLRGETLKEVLEANNGLPWPQLYPILRQILAGLSAAHTKEVIHRDLKPGNIFIEPDPAGPRVKLVDFGLSKIISLGSGPGMTALTEAGSVLGTPLYMAPEQVRGDPASSLSDLFAVGVILYRGLTGLFPFNGANAVDLYRNILRGAPVPPRQRTPERNIAEALDVITLRALAVDPAQRPQSAEDFLRQLDQCAQGAAPYQIAQIAPAQKKAQIVYDSQDDSDSMEETGSSEGPKTIIEVQSPFALAPSATNIPVFTPKPSGTMVPTSFWEPQDVPSHPSSVPQQPAFPPPKPLYHPSQGAVRPVNRPGSAQSGEKVLQKAPLPAAPKTPQKSPSGPQPPTRSHTPIPESPTPERRVREMPLVVPAKAPGQQAAPLPQQPPKHLEKTPLPNISVRRVLEMPALTDADKKK